MNTKAKVELFEGPDPLASAAARRFVEKVATASHPVVSVALPGGRIYETFFKRLAEEAQKVPGALDKVHFFWGDERCVPPNDPESNFRLAHDNLLGPLQVPPERIHRVHGELSPTAAAQGAEKEIRSLLKAPEGFPVIDYVLLGMGEDGHVASLFPGESTEQINSKAVYRAVVGPKPPPNRVTLGYGTIWAARNVWVLVSGAGKSGALKQSLSPGAATPLGRALANRAQSLVMTDCEM